MNFAQTELTGHVADTARDFAQTECLAGVIERDGVG